MQFGHRERYSCGIIRVYERPPWDVVAATTTTDNDTVVSNDEDRYRQRPVSLQKREGNEEKYTSLTGIRKKFSARRTRGRDVLA